MSRKNNIKSKLKTADDICKILTGKRLNQILAAAIDTFGEEVLNKATQEEAANPEELARRIPYMVLGVNPDAPDVVVKAAYKSLIRECHPDTNRPDEEKAKRINSAYEAICKERGTPK